MVGFAPCVSVSGPATVAPLLSHVKVACSGGDAFAAGGSARPILESCTLTVRGRRAHARTPVPWQCRRLPRIRSRGSQCVAVMSGDAGKGQIHALCWQPLLPVREGVHQMKDLSLNTLY